MKHSESGRMTMNTLSVMALIVLLFLMVAVAGVWLYRFIFDDSVGDSTIKEVHSRAITVSSRLISGRDPNADSEFGPMTKTGYPVSVSLVGGTFFEITLSQVPKRVCQYIVDRNQSFTTSVYLNGVLKQAKPLVCLKDNVISFEFSRNLNAAVPNSEKPYKTHCVVSDECAPCHECVDGLCKTGCRAEEQCALTEAGKEMCCAPQNKIESVCCSFMEDGNCCWGRQKCCPKEKPIRLEDGRCVSCYDTEPFAVGKEPSVAQCLTFCPNRVAFGQDELCMLPVCRAGFFTNRKGECISCHQSGSEVTSPAECNKCANRTYHDGVCQAGCLADSVMDGQGQCRDCDEMSGFVPASSESCQTACPNREMADGVCRLKTCPDGFVMNMIGTCVPCHQEGTIREISEEACQACAGRRYETGNLCVRTCGNNSFLSKDGQCISCSDNRVFPVDEGECLKCPDRLAYRGYCFADCGRNHFRDSNGVCHECKDEGSYPVAKTAACNVCVNRSIQLRRENGANQFYCRLGACPYDSASDEIGGCHDCFEPNPIVNISEEECRKCNNRIWSADGHKCMIKPTCMPEEIIDSNGQCVSCYGTDEIINVSGRETECNKCDKRYVYGPWCRNCPAEVKTLTDKDACQKCGGNWDNRIGVCQR